MANCHQKGRKSENLAAQFLRQHGMEIIDQNFRCPIGEIDMVGRDGKTVVFVEVKSRFAGRYGLPQESLTPSKQRRLTRLAQWYMKIKGMERQPARFDVIAVTWQDEEPEVTWIINAFEAHE